MSDKKLLFTWAVCELAGYQKGYITVNLNFKSNILSWKDSNRWYNNFVKGLPKKQMQPLYKTICEFVEENRDVEYKTPEKPQHYVWNLQIGDDSDSLELSGYDVDSKNWKTLVESIEKVGQRDFKL